MHTDYRQHGGKGDETASDHRYEKLNLFMGGEDETFFQLGIARHTKCMLSIIHYNQSCFQLRDRNVMIGTESSECYDIKAR